MKLEIALPDGFVRVSDTENYKGIPITVAYLFGQEALYFIGDAESSMENADWERIFSTRMANYFADMLAQQFPDDWSIDNPTGRAIINNDTITLVRED